MPQKKTNRYSKNSKNKTESDKDELVFRETGQQYAKVIKNFGGCHLEVFCYDGCKRSAHIRGKFRKRMWINVDDTILIATRDYQDNKCDVIHKYNSDEVRRLIHCKELPKNTSTNQLDINNETECVFSFDDI